MQNDRTEIVPFNHKYDMLLYLLRKFGVKSTNKRTGEIVTTHKGTYQIDLDFVNTEESILKLLPVMSNRAYYPHIAAAETAWQLMGTKDASFINTEAPKLWTKFTDDNGEIEAAYGYRWRAHFGRDQIFGAIAALQTDPSNRQVFVTAWDPAEDGLLRIGDRKNVPCPLGFTLNIIGGYLHCAVFVRSSDVVLGLPYDVLNYAMLMDMFASTLGVEMGSLSLTLSNAHYYDRHASVVSKILSYDTNDTRPREHVKFLGWNIHQITEHPEEYVKAYRAMSGQTGSHIFKPNLEVVV